jgi:hypothetical protein
MQVLALGFDEATRAREAEAELRRVLDLGLIATVPKRWVRSEHRASDSTST